LREADHSGARRWRSRSTSTPTLFPIYSNLLLMRRMRLSVSSLSPEVGFARAVLAHRCIITKVIENVISWRP
jgi:hypothetical protein